MPRKVKPAPINPVIVDGSGEDAESPATEIADATATTATEPTAIEATAIEAIEAPEASTRRPKKKLRRPTLSDTIPAIPVAAFQRLVRELSEERKIDMRWEAEALEALQVDAEAYLIEKFQQAKKTLDLFGSSKTVGGNMLRA